MGLICSMCKDKEGLCIHDMLILAAIAVVAVVAVWFLL